MLILSLLGIIFLIILFLLVVPLGFQEPEEAEHIPLHIAHKRLRHQGKQLSRSRRAKHSQNKSTKIMKMKHVVILLTFAAVSCSTPQLVTEYVVQKPVPPIQPTETHDVLIDRETGERFYVPKDTTWRY